MTTLGLLTLLTSTALQSTAVPSIQSTQTPKYFNILICIDANRVNCINLAVTSSPRGGKRICGNMLDKFNDSITSLYPVERQAEWWIYAGPDCGGKKWHVTKFGLDDLRYAHFNDMVSSLAVWPLASTSEDTNGNGAIDPGN